MSTLVQNQEHERELLAVYAAVDGVLTDAYRAEYQVFDASSGLPGTQVLPASGTEDVTTTGKFDTGSYYVYDPSTTKPWKPTSTVKRGYVKWTITQSSGGSPKYVYRSFEVVAESLTLQQGRALALIQDVRDADASLSTVSDAAILRALREWRDIIERYAKVHFAPVFEARSFSDGGSSILFLPEPLYAARYVKMNGSSAETTIANFKFFSYPRNMQNPRIEVDRGALGDIYDPGFAAEFKAGYTQEVKGVWGWFDPNTYGPPEPVRYDVVIHGVVLALHETFSDALGDTGIVVSERVDGHSVTYATTRMSSAFMGILRDARIRDVLSLYRAPLMIAAPAAYIPRGTD